MSENIWDAHDWFAPLGSAVNQAEQLGITAATTDDEMAKIVEREEATADNHADGSVTVNGLREHLEWVREEMREAEEKEQAS